MGAARPPLQPIRTAALMICTRDRSQELADCLASCRDLVGPPAFRIVICVADNNSAPQEDEIRLVGASLGLDLRYSHEPERGYASVRNRALDLAAAAGADMAAFIDDDSTAHPGLLAAHAAAMERYQADAILGRIEGLSQRPTEGRRVWKAGTGNVAMRRWVFDREAGAGLRFDPRLNLVGFEDWEFFGDVVAAGGVIYQSTEPVSISRPGLDASPTSAARPYSDRRAFAIMEGRNEIVATRLRHGLWAALGKVGRRRVPLLMQGALVWLSALVLAAGRDSRSREKREAARLRIAKGAAGIAGLWRPAFERPAARRGVLVELAAD